MSEKKKIINLQDRLKFKNNKVINLQQKNNTFARKKIINLCRKKLSIY